MAVGNRCRQVLAFLLPTGAGPGLRKTAYGRVAKLSYLPPDWEPGGLQLEGPNAPVLASSTHGPMTTSGMVGPECGVPAAAKVACRCVEVALRSRSQKQL